MEFVISREEFQRALERVQGIVDKRNTIPFLANVLVETIEEGIRITASDMEIAFTGQYEAQIVEPGEITLGAKQLFDIVRNLPQDTVHLRRLENDWMEITSGKAYFRVVGLSSDGYPSIPTLENTTAFHMSASSLKEMIEHTYFSIATDDSRYGLNGAYLERLEDESGMIRMISTDGHRLSLIDRPLDVNTEFGGGYLLPRKGLAELKKICDEFGSDDVEIAFGENSAIFRHDRTVFFMRLLEGDFPDYRQVIPKRSDTTLKMTRAGLQMALRRVSILSSEKTHSVRFTVNEDALEISASNPDLGESRESVDAEVVGKGLSVGFNAKYFQEALNVIAEEQVVLELGDSLNPGILRPENREDVMFVVMPMRLE